MLAIDDVHASYGRIAALENVSVHARGGEIIAIVGANGAGKTTLLKLIAGFLRPSSGRLVFDGHEISRLGVEERVRHGITMVPEGRQMWPDLTVEDHLRLGWFGTHRDRRRFQDRLNAVYDLFPAIADRRRQRAGTLSGGEQQMVAIGRALISEPRVLLLDEPTLGLAPLVNEAIAATLEETRGADRVVIVAEQNAEFALALADRAYVLEVGKCRMEGPALELSSRAELVAAYLGMAVGEPDTSAYSKD